MALFSVYDSVKRAIQDIISPELEGLKGQIQALHSEIRRLDEKITVEIRRLDEKISLESRRLEGKIDALDQKMTAEIRRLDGKIDTIDKKIDLAIQIHDRLARVEAKLGIP